MISGWFVFAVSVSIVFCAGVILAAALLRAAWARREREALTSDDLRALEESAVILIDQLKQETDRRIVEVEQLCNKLDSLIHEADTRLADFRELKSRPKPISGSHELTSLASGKVDSTEIVRSSGIGSAEDKLRMRLARIAEN